MATIKLQPSGNVLIKDGKVSCGCCEGPEGCCPYPAQGFVDGLYTFADLPDEIIFTKGSIGIFDNLLTKTGGPPSFYEGDYDGNLLSVIIEGNVWILVYAEEEFGLSSRNECLYVSDDEFDGSFDTFADTYLVTGPPGGAIVVTRVSLCLWEGTDSCGNDVRLEFISYAGDNDFPYWIISWFEYFGPVNDCNVLDSSSGVKEPYGQGGSGIDTPVGSYGPSYSVS